MDQYRSLDDEQNLSDTWRMSTSTTGDEITVDVPTTATIAAVDRDRGRDMWDWISIELDASAPASYRVQVATDEAFSDAREVAAVDYTTQSAGCCTASGQGSLPGAIFGVLAMFGLSGRRRERTAASCQG